jgi:hypothetical protein
MNATASTTKTSVGYGVTTENMISCKLTPTRECPGSSDIRGSTNPKTKASRGITVQNQKNVSIAITVCILTTTVLGFVLSGCGDDTTVIRF